MPYTEKQRKKAWAEVNRRRAGARPQAFKGMTLQELEKYARKPLHKKKK